MLVSIHGCWVCAVLNFERTCCPAAAWHAVPLRGEQRLLHPLLVTGLKIWHLRPDSRFYPKVQFWNAIRQLPQGAQVRGRMGSTCGLN